MSAVELTPDERVRRVKAALAEAGYPDADVWPAGEYVRTWPFEVPPEVSWRARFVAGIQRRCWPCASRWPLVASMPEPCDHDPLTSPWPEVVR